MPPGLEPNTGINFTPPPPGFEKNHTNSRVLTLKDPMTLERVVPVQTFSPPVQKDSQSKIVSPLRCSTDGPSFWDDIETAREKLQNKCDLSSAAYDAFKDDLKKRSCEHFATILNDERPREPEVERKQTEFEVNHINTLLEALNKTMEGLVASSEFFGFNLYDLNMGILTREIDKAKRHYQKMVMILFDLTAKDMTSFRGCIQNFIKAYSIKTRKLSKMAIIPNFNIRSLAISCVDKYMQKMLNLAKHLNMTIYFVSLSRNDLLQLGDVKRGDSHKLLEALDLNGRSLAEQFNSLFGNVHSISKALNEFRCD